jgi:hypothetical protein
MKLDFLNDFSDPYLRRNEGKGVFLAGVVLGMLARGQAGKNNPIDAAPIYKRIQFGRVHRRNILNYLSQIPKLGRVYHIDCAGMLESLCGKANEFLLSAENLELGVEGNFAFSTGFLNAYDYFEKKIFKENTPDTAEATEQQTDLQADQPEEEKNDVL